MRLLLGVIKAMQSTDPRIGPKDRAQAWRPRQNIDPTIMVSEVWTPLFQSLPPDAKRALTESLLAAWLDKNQQYSLGDFLLQASPRKATPCPRDWGASPAAEPGNPPRCSARPVSLPN